MPAAAKSPHERNWMQRMSAGRFNVVPGAQRTGVQKRRSDPLGFKPVTQRMMEASGRPPKSPPAAE